MFGEAVDWLEHEAEKFVLIHCFTRTKTPCSEWSMHRGLR